MAGSKSNREELSLSNCFPICPRKADLDSGHRGRLISAKTGREQMQQHAVRGRQGYSITSSARASSAGGNGEAERPGGAEIDHQLEFGWLQHRQIGRLGALEDATGIDASLTIIPPPAVCGRTCRLSRRERSFWNVGMPSLSQQTASPSIRQERTLSPVHRLEDQRVAPTSRCRCG